MSELRAVMDGNTAVAHVAYRVNEVCAIFPITPSSTMAELADEWSAKGIPNIWGNVPVVQEMQGDTAAEAIKRIMSSVDAFVGLTRQHDDITCLVLRMT